MIFIEKPFVFSLEFLSLINYLFVLFLLFIVCHFVALKIDIIR